MVDVTPRGRLIVELAELDAFDREDIRKVQAYCQKLHTDDAGVEAGESPAPGDRKDADGEAHDVR